MLPNDVLLGLFVHVDENKPSISLTKDAFTNGFSQTLNTKYEEIVQYFAQLNRGILTTIVIYRTFASFVGHLERLSNTLCD